MSNFHDTYCIESIEQMYITRVCPRITKHSLVKFLSTYRLFISQYFHK